MLVLFGEIFIILNGNELQKTNEKFVYTSKLKHTYEVKVISNFILKDLFEIKYLKSKSESSNNI